MILPWMTESFPALFDDRLSIIILTSCFQETTFGNSDNLILPTFQFFCNS